MKKILLLLLLVSQVAFGQAFKITNFDRFPDFASFPDPNRDTVFVKDIATGSMYYYDAEVGSYILLSSPSVITGTSNTDSINHTVVGNILSSVLNLSDDPADTGKMIILNDIRPTAGHQGLRSQVSYANDTDTDGVVTHTQVAFWNGMLSSYNATRILYVDKNRTDTYIETGIQEKPYKTIMGAVNAVIALGLSEYVTVDIANGIYNENIVLEDTALRYIKLQGNGYVSINPSSGNSLQSTTDNDNLFALHIANINFAKPVVITGSAGSTAFQDVMWKDVNFTGTATLSATSINNLSMKNVYSEHDFTYTNVNWSYIESSQLQGTFNFIADSTLDYPSWGANGQILANGTYQSGTVAYTIGGTATYTVAISSCRWGWQAVTVPTGITIYAHNSFLRGDITNNGTIYLRNSFMQKHIAGTGTLDLVGNNGNQIFFDNTITGLLASGNVQSAIDEITSTQGVANNVLYVDNKRTDTYVETGSVITPFKTITGALAKAKANGDGASIPYSFILSGSTYAEEINLNDAGLFSATFVGLSRIAINPASGNAVTSTTDNSMLQDLHFYNIEFGKPIVITGDGTLNQFKNVNFRNASFTDTATFTCMNSMSLIGLYASNTVTLSNVNYLYADGGQIQGLFTMSLDSGATAPSNGLVGGANIFGYITNAVSISVVGVGPVWNLSAHNSRMGLSSGSYTIPANTNVALYNSFLRGTWTNNGLLVLRNSLLSTYVAGTGTLNIADQKSKFYYYDNSVSLMTATNVQDAIDELHTLIRTLYIATYLVTNNFVSGEKINLGTGAGDITGVSTPAKDYSEICAWLDGSSKFNDNEFVVQLNGLELMKGVNYDYSATCEIELLTDADLGNYLTIKTRY